MTGSSPVEASTRRRVLDAAARLDYVPSATGRALRTSRTMTVSVLVPDLGNPVFVPFLQAVNEASRALDYAVLVVDAQRSKELERKALERLRAQRVDALVLAGAVRNPALIERLRHDGLIIADFTSDGLAQRSVAALEAPGTAAMCEALAQAGHRRVGYVHRGRLPGAAGRRRWQEVSRGCKRLGIEAERVGVEVPLREPGLAAAMTGLVRRANPVTAIVSSSHGLTPLLLAGLAGAGIDLPVECSFVSYGDSDWARAYRPAISVVAADLYAAGRLLTDAALSQLGHSTGYDTDRLPIAQFIPRASVAPRQGQ